MNSSMFHTLVKGRCNPPLTTGGAEPGQTAFPQGLSYDGRLLDLRVKKIFVKEKMFCSRVHIFAKFGVRTLLEVKEGMQVVCEEMRLRENHKKTATCGAET